MEDLAYEGYFLLGERLRESYFILFILLINFYIVNEKEFVKSVI